MSVEELQTALDNSRAMLEDLRAKNAIYDMRVFSRINRHRCESASGFNHLLSSWTLNDWYTAFMGEGGEAGNILKKLKRLEDGLVQGEQPVTNSHAALMKELEKELADAFCYLDLLAQAAGIELMPAVWRKFHEVSYRIGYTHPQAPQVPKKGAPE